MVVIHTPGIDRGRVRQAGDRNYLVLTVSGERIVRMRACRNRTWMTVAVAAGEVGRALRWDRVEAECVDPGPGRERAPLAVCWPLRFERMSPVPGFTSFRGQRNWPGWWWFYLHGRACGYESWLGRLLPRDQWQAQAARQAREPRLLVGGLSSSLSRGPAAQELRARNRGRVGAGMRVLPMCGLGP